MVLRKMSDLAITAKDKAIVWILIGAIFFAMRSCEYLRTSTSEDNKRTKILRTRNFRFKKNGKILPNSSHEIESADMVVITFEYQKNHKRNQSVHMYKTDDNILNPVLAWGKTVTRILSTIPDASNDTTICSFMDEHDKTIEFDAHHVRPKLRAIVHLIGKEILGYEQDDVGLHSICAGGAMAMFLSGVSEIIIQRVGRWCSFAFLEYIREQVDAFTLGVSQKMLQYEKFHHLNENEAKLVEKDETKPNMKNDGPTIHIPFSVHFSKQVLGSVTKSAPE